MTAGGGPERADGRAVDALRPCTIELHPLAFAEGSALIACGRTQVLCAATVEEGVPRWLEGSGRGWLTAEYAMLPRATTTRTARESTTGRVQGRTREIGRLIGRSLRAAVRLDAFGERTVTIDCDVLQADGGTRTAAITGGYVALALALRHVAPDAADRLLSPVAAVSVGVVGGVPLLDLDYAEDAIADTDANVVKAASGGYIEVQASAERAPFSRGELDRLLELADAGIARLLELQRGRLAAA